MRFDDFSIRLLPGRGDEVRVSVLDSPAGATEAPLGARLGSQHRRGTLSLEHLRQVQGADQSPRAGSRLGSEEAGAALFDALFPGPVHGLLDRSLTMAEQDGKGLRILLHSNMGDERLRSLLTLPWELAFWPQREQFLGLSRTTPIIRSLAVPTPATRLRLPRRLRILVLYAQSHVGPSLQLQSELEGVRRAAESDWVEVEAKPARQSALRESLQHRRPIHVFHFMGHGELNPTSGEGCLRFEGEGARDDLVSGKSLAHRLRDLPARPLVMLNACESGRLPRNAGADPFAGVAPALVRAGFPAVVAMQQAIPDVAAIAFSRRFYSSLSRGESVEVAVAEGRHGIHCWQSSTTAWSIPVLYLRSGAGRSPQHGEQDAWEALDSGKVLLRQGEVAQARSWFAKALDRDPGLELAQVFAVAGRMADRFDLSISDLQLLDRALSRLVGSQDAEVARLALFVLGVLRFDHCARWAWYRPAGPESRQVFLRLAASSRQPEERWLGDVLGVSSRARRSFNLPSKRGDHRAVRRTL